MSQHPYDDHDDLAALDFSSGYQSGSDDDVTDSDALDFSAARHDSGEESDFDALYEYAPAVAEETPSELAAIDSQTGAVAETEDDEEAAVQLFTVTNPSGTVSVSAAIDGRTQRVELSPKVTSMSESDLADEIIVLADLARQKGLAGQHAFLLDNQVLSEGLHELGLDGREVVRDFMENGMGLPTPEQAEAVQAEVFAARYAAHHD